MPSRVSACLWWPTSKQFVLRRRTPRHACASGSSRSWLTRRCLQPPPGLQPAIAGGALDPANAQSSD
eukprot:7112823-Alexandrium_andersonii.AAC.1